MQVTRDLGLTPSVLGLLLAAYGIGTVAGSLLSARRLSRGHVARILCGGALVMGLALVALSASSVVPVLLGLGVVAGVAQSMLLVTYITLRTAYSPDPLLGRIGSTARTISIGLQPVGLLVGGALVDLTSGSTTIALIGGGVILVSLAFWPVRAIRQATLAPR